MSLRRWNTALERRQGLRLALFTGAMMDEMDTSSSESSGQSVGSINSLSEDDAVLHFRFRKADLQDVANRLWPRLTEYLGDNPERVAVINRYNMPYETLFLLVLYRFFASKTSPERNGGLLRHAKVQDFGRH